MPRDVYIVDRLVIAIEGAARQARDSDADTLRVGLSYKNPLGSPGSTRRPPAMEVRDADGCVFEPVNADWAAPVLPDTEMRGEAIFEVGRHALDLEIVLAPGETDEAHVPLVTEEGTSGA